MNIAVTVPKKEAFHETREFCQRFIKSGANLMHFGAPSLFAELTINRRVVRQINKAVLYGDASFLQRLRKLCYRHRPEASDYNILCDLEDLFTEANRVDELCKKGDFVERKDVF